MNYPPQQSQSNGAGIAALIVGIIALILSIIPVVGLLSWILAPIAIVLGIVGMNRRYASRGTAIAGLATGGIALVVCILWVVLLFAAASAGSGSRNYYGAMQDMSAPA